MRKRTHHKHTARKGYRRMLDAIADHPAVHSVATGRVKPRMGAGRPVAAISKVRPVTSGLSVTFNAEGAMIDASSSPTGPTRSWSTCASAGGRDEQPS